MKYMDGLKEKILDRLQREIPKPVLTKNLRSDEYTCMIPDKKNPHFVIFKYSQDVKNIWDFEYKDFRDGFSSQLVCIFVNNDEYGELRYHIIGITDLLNMIPILPRDFIKGKDITQILSSTDLQDEQHFL